MTDIIAKEYRDFNKFSSDNINNFLDAKPFPYIELDNFFDENFLNQILDSFPKMSENKHNYNINSKAEVKLAIGTPEKIPGKINSFIEYLNSYFFLDFLQKLTGIKQRLIPDPYLFGAGLHEIKKGGILKVHTDFNKHPFKKLDRRINILIYLNKKWKKKYGGNLELWNKNMKKCEKKIRPTFNTMVIFSTNDFTNHGHPNPLNCPIKMSRKSLATYYFSRGRPNNEISEIVSKNTTVFKNRKGIKNDVSISDNKLRSYVRNLKFFKNLKDFEKKYLRTGKSRQKREN